MRPEKLKFITALLLSGVLLLSMNNHVRINNSSSKKLVIDNSFRLKESKQSASLIPGFNFPSNNISNDALYVTTQVKLGKFIPLSGNLDQLKYFFNALKNIKNKKVRIAHYGDSLIMGDLITGYLREKLQEKFSGIGVGYLPIVSDDYRMRRTVAQSSSDDWDYASFMTRNAEKLPYGINGTVAVPKNGSWVKYETTMFI